MVAIQFLPSMFPLKDGEMESHKVIIPCSGGCGTAAEITLPPGVEVSSSTMRTCAKCLKQKDRTTRTRSLPHCTRKVIHFPADMSAFTEEFAEKRRVARLAEARILDCPEFKGCLKDRERAVLCLWSRDLPENEILSQLAARGFDIGRDTLYRDIKRGIQKLRARYRRVASSKCISEDLRWIHAVIWAEGKVDADEDLKLHNLGPQELVAYKELHGKNQDTSLGAEGRLLFDDYSAESAP